MQEANVVTSENAAEFYAKKLDIAPAPAPAEAAPEKAAEPVVEQKTGQETTESEKQSDEAGKQQNPNPKLEKRFSELTKQREDARREAQREREAREAAERKAAELEAKLAPPKAVIEADAKPRPDQFTDAFEYAEALAEWSTENALKQRDKAEAEKRANAEREKVIKAWSERIETAKKELPDYEAMIASADVSVSNEVRDAILESEAGPKILYHLAANPEIAEALNSKSVVSALREIGKLEAKLLQEAPKEEAAKPAPKISRAPEPINPIQSVGSSVDVPVTSDGQFHGTYEQWKAARKAGKIR
jgi:colicin import membrane protein